MKRLLLSFILAAFAAGFLRATHVPAAANFAVPPRMKISDGAASLLRTDFASSSQHIQTHAASLVELRDGNVRAFWFAGSHEGAEDVDIRSAVFDTGKGQWGAEQVVATREVAEAALHRYIRKLGNPVVGRAADGTLWLFFVTVSVGGWAGSSITAMNSTDDGEHWGKPHRLVTSPFINISSLVKGAPFLYGDGSMGLPAYHEFIAKFGELLRFDRQGMLIDKQRLSSGTDHGLQPVLLVQNATDALVLMRHARDDHRKVISVSTRDAGQHWTAPVKTALSSPDSALSAVSLGDGRLVAVLNDQEQGRDTLSLEFSADDGNSWNKIYQLENQHNRRSDEADFIKVAESLAAATDAKAVSSSAEYAASASQQKCDGRSCYFEFSYPYLIRTQTGDFHLAYTWNRSFIKHVEFNQAWLDQQVKQARLCNFRT